LKEEEFYSEPAMTPAHSDDPEPNHTISWHNLREGIYRFVRSRLRNRSDAEDAAQEALLRALDHPDLSAIRDPVSYLRGIAQHVVFSIYAQQKRDSLNAPLDAARAERDGRFEPHEYAERAQMLAKLAEAMTTLPITQQRFLDNRLKGLTVEEAGREVGLSRWMAEKERAKAYAELTLQLGGSDSRTGRAGAMAEPPADQHREPATSTNDNEVHRESAR
jgi:RNA polymerase sigma-70 factor (ECF subfamily)